MIPSWLRRQLCCLFLGTVFAACPLIAMATDALPSLIAKIRPSVLAVGYFKPTGSPRFAFRGSGFVVGDGNLLVTNAHVIESGGDVSIDGSLVVNLNEFGGQGTFRPAEVVEFDRTHHYCPVK